MGEMRVLSRDGDIRVEWDPKDTDSVTKAHEEWKRLKDDGYEFFEVTETKGKRVTRFDKKIGKVIAAPGVKTKAERGTAAKPRAMSGGPNAPSPSGFFAG